MRNHGRPAGGLWGGGNDRRPAPARPPQPTRPKEDAWDKMKLGCEFSLSLALCKQVLFFESTKESSGISGEDYCSNFWGEKRSTFSSGDSGLAPRHYQCLAATADSALQEKAAQIKDLRPQDTDAYAKWGEFDKYQKLAKEMWEVEAFRPLRIEVNSFCEKRIDTIEETELASPDYGFCRLSHRPGQDCSYYKSIEENWGTKYGRTFCEGLGGAASKYRCLALRKQFIGLGKAMSDFGTATFMGFAEIKQKKYATTNFFMECDR